MRGRTDGDGPSGDRSHGDQVDSGGKRPMAFQTQQRSWHGGHGMVVMVMRNAPEHGGWGLHENSTGAYWHVGRTGVGHG